MASLNFVGLSVHSGKHHQPYFDFVHRQLQKLETDYDAGKVTDENLLDKIGRIEDKIRRSLLSGKEKLYENK
jgi:hypothetical protein